MRVPETQNYNNITIISLLFFLAELIKSLLHTQFSFSPHNPEVSEYQDSHSYRGTKRNTKRGEVNQPISLKQKLMQSDSKAGLSGLDGG